MKNYKVYISSYETDNPDGTYENDYDFPTFEEAQDFLEEEFWEFEESRSLTKRDTRYNSITKKWEEIPDSEYRYIFKITSNSFGISDDWTDRYGYIEEEELENNIPTGCWQFVNKHGLPTENGTYLCSVIAEPWEVEKGIHPQKYTTYLEFNDGYFYEDENGSNPNVYAWTDVIQPA